LRILLAPCAWIIRHMGGSLSAFLGLRKGALL
jgi:hypothetical protein